MTYIVTAEVARYFCTACVHVYGNGIEIAKTRDGARNTWQKHNLHNLLLQLRSRGFFFFTFNQEQIKKMHHEPDVVYKS